MILSEGQDVVLAIWRVCARFESKRSLGVGGAARSVSPLIHAPNAAQACVKRTLKIAIWLLQKHALEQKKGLLI